MNLHCLSGVIHMLDIGSCKSCVGMQVKFFACLELSTKLNKIGSTKGQLEQGLIY